MHHAIFGGRFYDSIHTGGRAMTTATLDKLADAGLDAYPDTHRGYYRLARNLGGVLADGPDEARTLDESTSQEREWGITADVPE